ncbi:MULTISPECIES: hypothetical protein [Parabacteroides]|uniref:DUF5018-related domain-containing protein n=3 Tax=Parabacteroides leei TaxID=2939491 RepID=UPI001899D7C6|nr:MULTISPECIES: hypothetical protein [Parabacteroides]MCL3853892.1 hypothetical protein [Parabacteroides leei]
MKNIARFTLFILLVISFSSCLKMGLDELPTSDKAEITNVKFEYRWWDETAEQIRVVEMTTNNQITDHTINCTITVPDITEKFTPEIREKISLSNLVCITDISAAASIRPINGAPALGTPGDFSGKTFSYLVVAADGSDIEWKINIIALNK